jgi:L-rhamnose mutarotase
MGAIGSDSIAPRNQEGIPMIRRAFTMRLQPGKLAEYKHFHDNVWPELVAEIENSGIATMTIFENDPVLFLYSEVMDENAWDKLWRTKIHDKWSEEAMNPLMFFRDNGIVDSSTLREVFHLETKAGAARRPTLVERSPWSPGRAGVSVNAPLFGSRPMAPRWCLSPAARRLWRRQQAASAKKAGAPRWWRQT